MSKRELDNLVKVGQLKAEPFSQSEFDSHLKSGLERLRDAQAAALSVPSRFLLAYGAAYQLALAALRSQGYRPANRYVVFQCLPHTLGVGPDIWRVLADAHDVRNGFEYEAVEEVTEDLHEQVVRCAEQLAALLSRSGRAGAAASPHPRAGWVQASKRNREVGDDKLVLPEFPDPEEE